jgi:Polyketide cyclase / dehydrase and lipid transport
MADSWRQQTLIEARVQDVWDVITDPSRYPEWADSVIDVTGAPTRIEKGSTFQQTTELPSLGEVTTTYQVQELDNLRGLKLRCTASGYYTRWSLTDARGATFTDVEVGIEPSGPMAEDAATVMTKGFLRRMADHMLDGVRNVLGGN